MRNIPLKLHTEFSECAMCWYFSMRRLLVPESIALDECIMTCVLIYCGFKCDEINGFNFILAVVVERDITLLYSL